MLDSERGIDYDYVDVVRTCGHTENITLPLGDDLLPIPEAIRRANVALCSPCYLSWDDPSIEGLRRIS